MNFFQKLEIILTSPQPSEKIALFKTFYTSYLKGTCHFNSDEPIMFFETPSYSHHCKIIAPQKVPKRKNVHEREGQVNLVHAIAHIEYSAIDLALDAAYRFRELPKAYYDDWLEVAADEIRHFEMLAQLLQELGSSYGDVAVHNSMFEASQRTQTLLERMAVVPRYLEANGLDATPEILEKLRRLPKNEMLEKIIATLEVILNEEVDHVLKGDRWFEYACSLNKVEKSSYFDIIKKYYPRAFVRDRKLNVTARQNAGFSCNEIKMMSASSVCE